MTVTTHPTRQPTRPAKTSWTRIASPFRIRSASSAPSASSTSFLLEQGEIDRVGHRLIAGVVHVEVVSGVVLLLNLGRRHRVAHRGVEVDDAVVRLAGPNPVAERLALGF